MLNTTLVNIIVKLLQKSNLSLEDRNNLTTAVLDKLEALPLRAIIENNEEGILLVNGREVDLEKAGMLRTNAKSLLESPLHKLIHQQVAFKAITMGVHKVKTVEEMIFARAALWWGQQEISLLKLLAGQEEDS